MIQPPRNTLACSFEPLVLFIVAFVFCLNSCAVTYAEESGKTYAVADALFDPSRVLKIDIEIEPEDWENLRKVSRDLFSSLQADTPAESPFKYIKGNITIDGTRINNVGIRKKGFLGSLDNNRPSLKIRFDKYQDQRPFGPLNRLTLNNNKQDDSKLSQYLSYKLFADSGVPAPRCNFARVKVNGESLGIYSHVESVKPAMLQRVFGDGAGLLAEGTIADTLPTTKNRFEYKSKRPKNTGIDKLSDLLASPKLDVADLDKVLNIDSFMRFWATETVIGFWDGYTHNQNNFFIYQNPEDSRLCFMPWGTDSAFTTYVPRIIDPIKNLSVHTNSAVANRLYHNPQMRDRYLNALKSILATQWDEEALLAEVDRVENMLADHVLSERKLKGGADRIRGFIKTRRDAIEEKLEKWPIPIETGPRVPGLVVQYGKLKGSFETIWTKKSPPDLESKGKTNVNASMNDEDLAFSTLGATTKISDNYNDQARDGIPTPTLIFTGVRKSDNKTFTFVAKVKPEDFHPSKKEVPVNGVLIEGSMIAFFTMLSINPGAIKLISGSVQLDEASMEAGAEVSGEVNLKVVGFSQKKAERTTWVTE
ncbi:MAG: CotH kinase family protein [Rubripirellula sp.]